MGHGVGLAGSLRGREPQLAVDRPDGRVIGSARTRDLHGGARSSHAQQKNSDRVQIQAHQFVLPTLLFSAVRLRDWHSIGRTGFQIGLSVSNNVVFCGKWIWICLNTK